MCNCYCKTTVIFSTAAFAFSGLTGVSITQRTYRAVVYAPVHRQLAGGTRVDEVQSVFRHADRQQCRSGSRPE